MFDKMQERWGVGPWRVLLILIVFTLTGLTVVRIKGPIMGAILPADAPGWLSWAVYLLVIFPIYQVILLMYGALFGQFGFFWDKFRVVGRFLARKSAPGARSGAQNRQGDG